MGPSLLLACVWSLVQVTCLAALESTQTRKKSSWQTGLLAQSRTLSGCTWPSQGNKNTVSKEKRTCLARNWPENRDQLLRSPVLTKVKSLKWVIPPLISELLFQRDHTIDLWHCALLAACGQGSVWSAFSCHARPREHSPSQVQAVVR